VQRKEEKPGHIKLTLKVQAIIKKDIGKEWSTEQIQGRLIFESHEMVCATSIYYYIQQDKAAGGELCKSLRHKKSHKNAQVRKIKEIKLWVGLVLMKGLPSLIARSVWGLAERCSRKTLIEHIKSKHAEVVSDAVIRLLKGEKENWHTITFDNGKEFAYHAKIKNALACNNYFSHPYCSWERGLKKGMALKVTSKEIKSIHNKLNNRPSKSLDYQTPNEVYNAM
jgi:IS30 family transposase